VNKRYNGGPSRLAPRSGERRDDIRVECRTRRATVAADRKAEIPHSRLCLSVVSVRRAGVTPRIVKQHPQASEWSHSCWARLSAATIDVKSAAGLGDRPSGRRLFGSKDPALCINAWN